MIRAAIILLILSLPCLGCRSQERVTYSIETTGRTSANPWDDRIIDRVDLSVTFRKGW